MTPFELWQAGRGEEPVVVAALPCRFAFMPPWGFFCLGDFATRGDKTMLSEIEEGQAAAEECRAALAAALACTEIRALEHTLDGFREEVQRTLAGLRRVRRNGGDGMEWLDLPINNLETACGTAERRESR